jgi:Abnormal spindle-like microcephaly-assoc'd, ASPM-SPD-2-Hydin/WD40-like Beta Propeller Repeat
MMIASVGWIGEGQSAAAGPAELISIDPTTGGPLDSQDNNPSVSSDGNIVVFTATSFINESSVDQVYVRNRSTNTTSGIPAGSFPAILTTTAGVVSRDGCHVAFFGLADHVTINIFGSIIEIVPFQWEVYAWNRCAAGPPIVVSPVDLPLLTEAGAQRGPLAISANGRYVAYVAAPFNGQFFIGRLDTNTPGTEARLTNGVFTGNSIDISDDGAFLAIGGQATVDDITRNVVQGWTPPCVPSGEFGSNCNTELLNVGNNSALFSGFSANPSISADGRYVAFSSDTRDFVSLPAGVLSSEVYVRDRAAQVTKLITDTPGVAMDGRLDEPDISPDGTQIALQRRASDSNPVAGDIAEVYVARSTSGYFDSAVFDLVSFGVSGAPTSQDSTVPSMSSNGRWVAFASTANDELSGVEMPVGQNVWMRQRPIALDITPSVDFGTVDVGGTSAPKNAVITNTSGVAINIGSVVPPAAPFAITANGCGGALAPGASCGVTMVFSPTAGGGATSSLTVSGDGLSVSSALVGVGRSPNVPIPGSLTIAPGSANFGSADIGGTLPARRFTVSNPGQTPVTILGIGLSGAGADQFLIGTNTCTGALAGGGSCSIDVSATVTRTGNQSAQLGVLGSGGVSATATLRIGGTLEQFTPTLLMNPGVVSAGQVTAAIGTGFPPNIQVELAFADEPPFAKVLTKPDGSLRFDLLILRNGIRIGGRQILALDQPQFSGVFAPLLIDLATFRPSGFISPAITSGVRSLFSRGG